MYQKRQKTDMSGRVQKVIADETKTAEIEKGNQGDKTSAAEKAKNNKNTSKTNEPGTEHFKLHQETLGEKNLT